MSKAKKGKPGFFAGKRHTEASRKKMSVAKTGARSPRARAVRQLTLEGREVAVFSTLREAKDTTGVSVENIQNVLTGRGKTAGGYRWEDAAR